MATKGHCPSRVGDSGDLPLLEHAIAAERVYEVGWMVVPEFQGRGVAMAATAQAIELAKPETRTASCTPSRTSITRRRTRSAASSASICSRHASSSSRRALHDL
jgi:hypothetical protein